MPTRILKVLCTGAEQDAVAAKHRTVERYEGFVVVEASPAEAEALGAEHLVEDITDDFVIHLPDRDIDTSRPRLDAKGRTHPHPAYAGAEPLGPGEHHYLVQFVGPIKAAWLAKVKRAGGEPRRALGAFDYAVRAGGEAVPRIAALPFVRWMGHLPHRSRIAQSLLRGAGLARLESPAAARAAHERETALPRRRVLPGALTVEFFGKTDLARGRRAVKALGLAIIAEDAGAGTLVVRGPGARAELRAAVDALAAVPGVRLVRERTLPRSANDVAAGLMGARAVRAPDGLGLSGKGEIVAVCDTGLDSGDASRIHPDFARRIASLESFPITADFAEYVENPGADDGPADLDSGHGTHVAGSVLGSGEGSRGVPGLGEPIRGLAPGARLVFQAVEQELRWKDPRDEEQLGRYLLAGIPGDLAVLFRAAYGRRARIHSNSWGGGDPGVYDGQCEQLDRFVREHPDFCVVVAAGNDGSDADGDGRINLGSVTSPGTAKNCITVGASESVRPEFDGRTYGSFWPRDYPVSPFAKDDMADDADQVAAFSSRGPTKDGRVKPDVVAPGTFILSTRSRKLAPNNFAWGAFPGSKLYFFMGGTSMATPLTAGAVALLREYLRRKARIARPSAALLRAALVAGARRLPGHGEGGAVVDPHQGFGAVNLEAVLAPKSPSAARFVDERPGLRTGEVNALVVKVTSGAVPLRVVLAYSDAPGPRLVNDLNVVVRGPGGVVRVGNQAEGKPGKLDAKNNVEVVEVRRPAAGEWKVEVVASSVPEGPQPYALAILAGSGA